MELSFAVFDAAGKLIYHVPDKAQAVLLAQAAHGTWQRQLSPQAQGQQSPQAQGQQPSRHPGQHPASIPPQRALEIAQRSFESLWDSPPEVRPLTGSDGGFVVVQAMPPEQPVRQQAPQQQAPQQQAPQQQAPQGHNRPSVRIFKRGFTAPAQASGRPVRTAYPIAVQGASGAKPPRGVPLLVAPEEDYLLPVVQAWHQRPDIPNKPSEPAPQTRPHPAWDVNKTVLKTDAQWQRRKELKQGSQAPVAPKPQEESSDFEDRLVRASLDGNMTAFGQFMLRHKTRLLQLATAYTRNPADGEDIYAASFGAVWGVLREESSDIYGRCQQADRPALELLHYVMSAIKYRSYNLHESKKHRRAAPLEEGVHEADAASTMRLSSNWGMVPQDEMLIRAENRVDFNRACKHMQQDVQAVLDQEEPVYSQIWHMRYGDGSTPNEIAVTLDIPAGTANSRLGRMRKKVEAKYGTLFLEMYEEAMRLKRDRTPPEDKGGTPPESRENPARGKKAWRNPMAHFRKKRNPASACALTGGNCALSGSAGASLACIRKALEAQESHTVWVLRSDALALSFRPDVTEAEQRWLAGEIACKLAG